MVRLISRQHGGLAALKLTKLFGIDDFPGAKDCYLIIMEDSFYFCAYFYYINQRNLDLR